MSDNFNETGYGLAQGLNQAGSILQEQMLARQKAEMEARKLQLTMDTAALSKGYIRTTPEDEMGIDIFGSGQPYKLDIARTQQEQGGSNLNQAIPEPERKSLIREYGLSNDDLPQGSTYRFWNAFSPSVMEEKKFKIGVTKDTNKEFRKTAQPAAKLLLNLSDIRMASQKLDDYQPGLFNQIKAKTSYELSKLAADDPVAKYHAFITSTLTQMVKGYMGDVGNITQSERDQALKSIGDPSLPIGTKLDIIDRLMDKVRLNVEVSLDSVPDVSAERMIRDYGTIYDLMGGDDWYFSYVQKRNDRELKLRESQKNWKNKKKSAAPVQSIEMTDPGTGISINTADFE